MRVLLCPGCHGLRSPAGSDARGTNSGPAVEATGTEGRVAERHSHPRSGGGSAGTQSAENCGLAPLPPRRPTKGQRIEWEESIVKAEEKMLGKD